jgi:Lar family restriction alleviation protein
MKHCPFCGGTARAAVTHPAPLYAGICEWCGARGPDRESIVEAIAAWDNRFTRQHIPAAVRRAPPDITDQQ